MPKYVDITSLVAEFGKNRDTQQLNIHYRYFKAIFHVNLDSASYISLRGSPLTLIHDIPLFDYNSAQKQVTNI